MNFERLLPELQGMKADVQAFIERNTEKQAGLEHRLDKVEVLQNRVPHGDWTGPRKVTNTVTASDGWRALKNGQPTSGRINVPLTIKALTSTQAGGSPNDGYQVQPQRYPGIGEDPRRPLSVLDVLPSIQANSNSFEYHELSGYSSNAGYQTSEGAVKSETSLPLALRSAPIKTIAHFLKASRQVLDDVAALQAYVEGLLLHGVRAKLEAEVINGTTAGGIQGLYTSAQTFAPTAALAPADRISEVSATLIDAGWNPGLVIMKGAMWHTIRVDRDNDDGYVATGWDRPGVPNIWNLPVVLTPSMPTNQALVLDPRSVLLLDRMQATVQVGFDGDDFSRNLVTILAELRAGMAIISNGGIYRVQLS